MANNSNHLDVKTFFKKTNTFQYLHYKSAHPPSTRKAVIIGEANRFNSNPENFNQTISELTMDGCVKKIRNESDNSKPIRPCGLMMMLPE